MEGISEGLAYELAEIGVKVKIIEPGAVKIDFKFVIMNDEEIGEYRTLIQGLNEFVKLTREQGSSANLIAGVIYEAATDGTDRLRIP